MRDFFARRGVLEVETPLLALATTPDPHLHSLSCSVSAADGDLRLFLQTSPELAMKRLLAAGSGSIYQICRAFRDQEQGRLHNLEFTLLEWYRVGVDHHRLMDEVEALLVEVVGAPPAERMSYRDAFARQLGLDPHAAELAELARRSRELGLATELADRDDYLTLLMSHAIEQQLGRERPTFLYDYPASQAALARVRPGPPAVAERFELYWRGVELANGFHELSDPDEQRRRFEAELAERRRRGLESVPIDDRFLAALEHGLPDCAGVALGVDRLLMVALGLENLSAVLAFPIDRL